MLKSLQEQSNKLKPTLKSRHLFMISLGGVIGSGLFLSSGYTISQAGPGGAILAYLTGGLIMYLTMMCLGELSVALPDSGSFQSYASRLISPAFGFTVGWLYWINWATTIGIELTSMSILMKRWFPDVDGWIWCILFGLALFVFNAFSAKGFAESEFWFSSVKVIAILLFILLGGAAVFGLIDFKDGTSAPYFSHFVDDGGLFPQGVGAVFLTMVTVGFSFQGAEVIGITSGESQNPNETIPRAIRNTVWRLLFFFLFTIMILTAIIPWRQAGLIESPFVTVFDKIGIPYAADWMNFVILTALFSVANSGVYACSRMIWSMSSRQMVSPFFSKLTSRGIPLRALVLTMAVASLSLLTGKYAESTVYLWLISISSFAGISVWASIGLSAYRFRKQYLAQGGKLEDLAYRVPLFPLVPLLVCVLNLGILVTLAWIPDQRLALYSGIPLAAFLFFYYKWKERRNRTTWEAAANPTSQKASS